MLAAATVHTTGINWGSVTLLICTICGTMTAVITFLVNRWQKRSESRDEQWKSFVTGQVSALGALLDVRLTTITDRQGQAAVMIDDLAERVDDSRERLAAVEGQLGLPRRQTGHTGGRHRIQLGRPGRRGQKFGHRWTENGMFGYARRHVHYDQRTARRSVVGRVRAPLQDRPEDGERVV